MRKAQSLLEYSVLMIIIVAAFLTMQVYIKRGVQGRWKQAVDDMGEQYDARGYNGLVRYTLNTTAESRLYLVPVINMTGTNGFVTYRNDTSLSIETKTGNSHLDPTGL
jgi:hypothetical protein